MDQPVTIITVVLSVIGTLTYIIKYYLKKDKNMTEEIIHQLKKIAERNIQLEMENRRLLDKVNTKTAKI